MKYVSKKLLLLPIFILLLSFFSLRAQAQNAPGYDVTVSPSFFDFSGNPETKISDKIKIRNNTDKPITFTVKVERMSGDANGNLSLSDNNDPTLSWIKFTDEKFTVKPLDWYEASFTIDIPSDAAYGYYWAARFTEEKSTNVKNAALVTASSAVPILLNVKKEGAKADAKVVQFTTANYINEYLPVDFTVKVENTGNIHIKPHGSIFISQGNGKDLAILDVNQTLGTILPQSSRVFNASWADGFIVRQAVIEDGQPKLDKNGKPVMETKINWNKLTDFRIGKYNADLLMVFDNGQKDVPIEASVSFWVFPYKIVGLGIAAIVILLLAIRFILKVYISREVNKRTSKPQ